MVKSATVFLLLSAWSYAWGAQVDVRGARLTSDGGEVRLAIDLSGAFTHKIFSLENPDRLVIDIPDAALRCKLPVAAGDHGTITGLRSGIRQGDDLRIVVDLKRPVRAKSFEEGSRGKGDFRLVVDLAPSGSATKAGDAKRLTIASKAAKPRTLVVAIDAGHGGKDAGAIGSKGTKEKDVTLSVARRLAKLIAKERGMRAYLTRDNDTFVGLRTRMTRARKQNADLFVSIHADAFQDPDVGGSSVYTLSPRGASSEAAKWLADKENAADLVGGVKLGEGGGDLATMLLDMSQNATMEQSGAAAELVLSRLAKLGGLHNARVQRAGFVVLKSPDVPSMLVEAAFISNPKEEAKLRDPSHQQRLAEAILTGIKAYFKKYPAPPLGRGGNLADVGRR